MKKYLYLCCLGVLMLGFVGCEEFVDDKLDFSDTYPAYIRFTNGSGDVNITPGESFEIELEIPETVYQDVTVNYTITGDYQSTGNITFPSGAYQETFEILIPADADPNGTAVNSTLTLTEASGGIAVGRGVAGIDVLSINLLF